MEKKHAELTAVHESILDDLTMFIQFVVDNFPAGATSQRAIAMKNFIATKYPGYLERYSPMYLAEIREEIQQYNKKKRRR